MPARQANRRAFAFACKSLDDQRGTFEGYLAVFGNEDQGGDVIEQGAFRKTLQELKAKQAARGARYLLPLLWAHNPNDPIGGILDAYEDDRGLYIKAELDLDVPGGQRAYSGMKKGYLLGLSIGYEAIKPLIRNGVRYLKELALFEGSCTPFPMNEEALVDEVKNRVTNTASVPPTAAITIGGTSTMANRKARNRARIAKMREQHADASQRVKARDFSTMLTRIQDSDELQSDWHDAFQAFVNSFYSLMWDAHWQAMSASPSGSGESTQPDPADAAKTNMEQLTETVLDLVSRSLAADFAPILDDDGDSFDDPDDDDDDDCDYMSAGAPSGRKAGRQFSAANKATMQTSLTNIKSAIGMLNDEHKSMSDLLAASEPSSSDDNDDTQEDGKPKKSLTSPFPGAGASATTPQQRTQPSADVDVEKFRRMMAELRSGGR